MNEYHEHDEPEVEIETESESVRNDYREAAWKVWDFYRKRDMAVMAYKGPRQFAFECSLLAFLEFDILGCDSQVKLAERWKCTKANVGKCVNFIQKLTGAPPIPGQRSTEGKNKMSEKRKGQLK